MAKQQGSARTGVVVRLVRDRGFGFIKDDQTNEELFFHRSEITNFDALVEKQTRVRFFNGQGPKGPRAEQVVTL